MDKYVPVDTASYPWQLQSYFHNFLNSYQSSNYKLLTEYTEHVCLRISFYNFIRVFSQFSSNVTSSKFNILSAEDGKGSPAPAAGTDGYARVHKPTS